MGKIVFIMRFGGSSQKKKKDLEDKNQKSGDRSDRISGTCNQKKRGYILEGN